MTQLVLTPPDPVGAMPSGGSDEWYTPRQTFREWEARFGGFTLDVCATRESAKCPRYFDLAGDGSLAVDGLAQDWSGERVWCNPPYSTPNLERWMAKCSSEAPRTHLLVALVPVWCDRPWWQKYVKPGRLAGTLEVDELPGRIRFGWPGNTGGSWTTGTFPSALIIWRGHRGR